MGGVQLRPSLNLSVEDESSETLRVKRYLPAAEGDVYSKFIVIATQRTSLDQRRIG
jgi:hypothetical protein